MFRSVYLLSVFVVLSLSAPSPQDAAAPAADAAAAPAADGIEKYFKNEMKNIFF